MEVIDVCNLALAHLGMLPITSLSDTDPSSKACNRYFTTCRDEVFEDYPWPFALVQEALTENESITVVGWDFVYTYPNSAAAVWDIYNEASVQNKHTQKFQIMYNTTLGSKIICTDTEEAYVDFTYKVSDPDLWDSKFIDALSYKLAGKMAHDLTGDIQIGQAMGQTYMALIGEARRLANKGKIKPNQESSYVNSR